MTEDKVDFDQVFRGRGESLVPPNGTWRAISRRALRRKRAKRTLSVAAGIVVIAGAAPAVLAVTGTSDNQRLQVTTTPPNNSSATIGDGAANPVVHPSLAALVPTSVTFVTQSEGWVSGALEVPGGTVAGGLARTETAGTSWAIEDPHPPADGTVRFADSKQGLSFGQDYQETNDGGLTWQSLPSPGFISDLETSNGVIWALVRSCAHCDGLRLFQATLTDPTLVRVASVRPIGALDAAITLHGHAIYITGGNAMWVSVNDGYSWSHPQNPCGDGNQAFSAWSDKGLAAECTPARGLGSLFESMDAGAHWTNIANVPHVQAGTGTLSAGSPDELLITTGTTAPYVSHHHGSHWTRAPITGAVTFAAYISDTHIVGIASGRVPTFVSSFDDGRTWTQTPFLAPATP